VEYALLEGAGRQRFHRQSISIDRGAPIGRYFTGDRSCVAMEKRMTVLSHREYFVRINA
jgi:hypothetical protein